MTSSVQAEMMNVSFCWVANTGVSMCWSPLAKVIYEFIFTSTKLYIYMCVWLCAQIKLSAKYTAMEWTNGLPHKHPHKQIPKSNIESKVGDRSRGRPEGSLFDSYYNKELGRALLLSLDCHTLPLIRALYCRLLSKEVSSTISKVFGMTRPGIEPRSSRPLANTLPNRPMSRLWNIHLNETLNEFILRVDSTTTCLR